MPSTAPTSTWPRIHLPADRYFSPDPQQKRIAQDLHESVAGLPLICPHGHVDPRIFADPNYTFGNPTELLVTPDHYVHRMLYSQGIPVEALGLPRRDGSPADIDPRKVWQTFADNFHLFRATPSGLWLNHELVSVFGVDYRLSGETAQYIYDQIAERLRQPDFTPRRLFERFNIEALSTTDGVSDSLTHHQAIRDDCWQGRVIPTLRPDGVVNLDAPGWRQNIAALGAACGFEIGSYRAYLDALRQRRAFFKSMGATATDHSALTAFTAELDESEAEAIFQRALRGQAGGQDAARFTGHMLMVMAGMSLEASDSLVMQLHVGSLRNHNASFFDRFGPDKGCDIPVAGEFTRDLRPLLNKYGNDPRLTLIFFTLDESTYSRELAPMAGHYPALRLGPPWWFHDSINGMTRYFESVVETAGLYNTVGFNDDTRALASIPVRHDLFRRVVANWLAGLVVAGIVAHDEAREMIVDAAYRLPKKAYRL
jgi:glucuronate isomerase